jgi:diaminopimelate decarboxylase
VTDWRLLAHRASDIVGTPCYLMSERIVRESLARLRALESSVPLRHWVSLKTQPVARVVHTALDLGLGVDVVSEYELAGALSAGVPANRILVNGVGKHHWLPRHRVPNLTVHFDSLAEVRALAVLAKALHWRVGLRCAIPERGGVIQDQFGMTPEELQAGAALLVNTGVAVHGLHFHLHTSMHRVDDYRHALNCVADIAESLQLQPQYVDVGGGLPIAGEKSTDGACAAGTFDLDEYRELLTSIPTMVPSVREVWLENGRFLTGPAGALVISVLDKKVRGGDTHLICDGGRVNHARMAAFEEHEIMLSPMRAGPSRKTIVCGPTCSAVDRLGCWMLPESIEPGDQIIWMTAGAYHIPLETRFSIGLSPVVWFNRQDEAEVIRKRETAAQWWGQWEQTERRQHAFA